MNQELELAQAESGEASCQAVRSWGLRLQEQVILRTFGGQCLHCHCGTAALRGLGFFIWKKDSGAFLGVVRGGKDEVLEDALETVTAKQLPLG